MVTAHAPLHVHYRCCFICFEVFCFIVWELGSKVLQWPSYFLIKFQQKMSKVCLQGLDRFTSHVYLMKLYPHKVAEVSGNPSFHEKPGWCNIMIYYDLVRKTNTNMYIIYVPCPPRPGEFLGSREIYEVFGQNPMYFNSWCFYRPHRLPKFCKVAAQSRTVTLFGHLSWVVSSGLSIRGLPKQKTFSLMVLWSQIHI